MTTTNDRVAALRERRTRDRFPARSARILVTGFSFASILGVASAIEASTPPHVQTPTASLDDHADVLTSETAPAPAARDAVLAFPDVPGITAGSPAPRRVVVDLPVNPESVASPSATSSGSK